MASVYTRRFFVYTDAIAFPSWTVPDDGNVYVLRDVWWSVIGLDVASQSVELRIAGVGVWGAVPTTQQSGPGVTWWYWQGRQVVEAGEEVALLPVPSSLAYFPQWIGTGYVLTP